jgi:hypothetical protein
MIHQEQKHPQQSQPGQMDKATDAPANSFSPPAFQLKASSLGESEGENDAVQLKEGGGSGHTAQTPPPADGKGNLPTQLRSSMEAMSGISLGDVNVNYNSSKPAQMQAHAFAQGSDIHLGAGQEKHLGHEAWHVVQQKQGRVTANTEVNGAPVNDNAGLEKEADDMGAKALQMKAEPQGGLKTASTDGGAPMQGKWMHAAVDLGSVQPMELGGSSDIEMDLGHSDGEMAMNEQVSESVSWESFAEMADESGFGSLVDQVEEVIYASDELRTKVLEFLQMAEQSGQEFAIRDLITMIFDLIAKNASPDSESADDGGDHISMPDTKEIVADPEKDIDVAALASKDMHMMFLVFSNWIRSKGINVDDSVMYDKFIQWFYGGVHTRSMIRKLFETEAGDQVMQLARTPNTVSTQASYITKNFGQFQDVSYMRDGKGNIDFSSTWGAPTAWSDPVLHGSKVELSTNVTKAGHGLMPSGKLVNIASASRSQHFAIGDRLDPTGTARQGKYTWHHLSPEYQMVLVDMQVHAKHGHNGGVYLWK